MVAQMTDLVFSVSAAVADSGRFGMFCVLSFAVLKATPFFCHFFLQFLLEMSVCPGQKIFLSLQLSDSLFQIFNFLPQLLNFHYQLLQFLIIKMIKLMHLQLNYFLSEFIVFLQKLLQLKFLIVVRRWRLYGCLSLRTGSFLVLILVSSRGRCGLVVAGSESFSLATFHQLSYYCDFENTVDLPKIFSSLAPQLCLYQSSTHSSTLLQRSISSGQDLAQVKIVPPYDALYSFRLRMEVQKKHRKGPVSPSLQQLISQHSDLALFFSQHAGSDGYETLAVRLMRQAIAIQAPRNIQDKHYNVAYVKHNRFLSPSQKQAVSPKVTEIIPVSPEPIKIFGKPKVKLDDQFACSEEQIPEKVLTMTGVGSQTELNTFSPEKTINNCRDPQNESQKYLSPRIPQPKHKQKVTEPKNDSHKQAKMRDTGKMTTKGDLKIDSNFHSTSKIDRNSIQSPKNVGIKENYQNVESRIKFLVDRDKKNSRIRQQLEEQNRKIDQLETRQQKLLLRQYEQTKDLNKAVSRPQLPCCCVSSDEQLTQKLLQLRKEKVKANYHSTLSNIRERLSSPKVHKITGHQLYPLSSSSDSDSSSEEVVVAAMY